MILLSALLASLSGMVAGERQPVRAPAQVQSSVMTAVAQPEVTVVAMKAAKFVQYFQSDVRVSSERRPSAAGSVQRLPLRLALKQSWLN